MESKNQANKEIHSLFQKPANRENFQLFYKSLSQPSKGFCLCQVQPEERLKILEFFDNDPLKERIYIIDMVKPLRGSMELQQTVIDADEKFGSTKDIFFIYNLEECIRLLKTTPENFFQGMNLIRDFFMQFEAVFVFFVTESLVKTMIQNAFDFYDWMKFTFIFVSESKGIEIGENEERKYSNLHEKIKYLKDSIKGIKNEKAGAMRLLELGKLYFQVGDYDNALEFFGKALKIFEENDDRNNMKMVRAEMGKIHQLKKEYKNVVYSKRAGAADHDEFNWQELLWRITHKNVIPVIGHGLYRVDVESEGKREVLLYDYLAEQLAEAYGFTLNPEENHKFAKACLAFLRKGRFWVLKKFLMETLERIRPVPSDSLRKLARIKGFNMFITTAYNDFLTDTLITVRSIPPEVFSFSLRQKWLSKLTHKLFEAVENSRCTLVYHIFGEMKKNIDPAFTEKDILETIISFGKDMAIEPRNILVRELEKSSLLFIGCSFDDWLYRLFIRTIATEPYHFQRVMPTSKYVVDNFDNMQRDPSNELPRFLKDYGTEVFHTNNCGNFVDLLFEKLETAYPGEIIQSFDFPNTAFISFEGSDRATAQRLAAHLREDGINVWLHEKDFKPGDRVNLTIKKIIDQCPVFIPLISENSRPIETQDGKLKYHIQEWEFASSRQIAGKDITIRPVKIDDTGWMYGPLKGVVCFKVPGGRRKGDYEKLKARLLEVQRSGPQK